MGYSPHIDLKNLGNLEHGMAVQCFAKKNSNPPICGVHNVPLVQLNSENIETFLIGVFTYFICPVSRRVVDTP
jgi:hypothetical protein